MIAGMEHIRVKTGKHCIFATMQEALCYSGSNLTEAALFFLCGGMNIPYLGDPRTFWFKRMDQLTEPLVQSQSQFSLRNTPQAEKVNFRKDCMDSLSQGYPVLLLVHSQCLSYHRAYTENKTRGHVVMLYGLDWDRDEAHIADAYLLDNSGRIHTYQGPVPLQELEAGCFSVTSYRPRSEHRQTSEAVLLGAYANHIDQFLEPDRTPSEGGLNANRQVISDLEDWAGMSGKELRQSCQEVYYGLRVGGILHHIDYIQMFADDAGLSLRAGYREAMLLLETVYREWKMYLLLLYKTGVQGRAARMKELSASGLRLLELYEEALRAYSRWLRAEGIGESLN
ncbi:BtrH N-terminal domain-containing protein [Paenibacillus sp. HB172176]|uniref:BtrH N-terminal domain-containing protein n=1 Tax=Paenibacillus sp. HB172176 TaxID=2493690 RepID=UPI00143CA333|nr:BtrH N-terminal domain-containing protein [Paenibacillus sp. HB172176]